MSLRPLLALALLLVLATGFAWPALAAEPLPASKPSKPSKQTRTRFRGEVASVEGDLITLRTREGGYAGVNLFKSGNSATEIDGVKPFDPASVVVGTYVGIVSQPVSEGPYRALAVIVMPPAMRSTSGHSAYDLHADTLLTLGPISGLADSATGRIVTVHYQGAGKEGYVTILVPPATPVVTFVPLDATKIVPGAQVIVEATRARDGSWRADDVIVGVEIVPPM